MGPAHGTGADGYADDFLAHRGMGTEHGQDHARRTDHGHRCRTDGEVHQAGHQPCQNDGVHIQLGQGGGQCVTHAAVHQNAVEGPAGTDDQQNAGQRREALLGVSQQLSHAQPAAQAQRPIGKHHGNGQGDQGSAQK